LLDTNILSELRRPRPDSNTIDFIGAQPAEFLFTSDVTLAEMVFGIEQVADADQRAALHDWLENQVRPAFRERTLGIDESVIVRWKRMMMAGRKSGHTFSQPDLFIAAIAAGAGLIVVSRDTSQFVAARVPVLDPFEGELYLGENRLGRRAVWPFAEAAAALVRLKSC
jgi:predicted nucleic acid-binding protein